MVIYLKKVNILGVGVNMSGISESADIIMRFLEDNDFHSVYTPNSEIIMNAYRDADFCALLNRANLLTADGIGVVYASRILKRPISERAAGYDIACEVLRRLADAPHRLFLFGGKPGVAEKARENLERDYPHIQIAGTRNGYFSCEQVPDIINEINKSGADLLFVCLGAPMQEKWIDANKDKLNVCVAMGIGGSLDVFAGEVRRAPDAWRRLGLEWLYRLIKEPWRFMRMMALPKFALTVLAHGRKFPQEDL
jgi:N-acetylglucosaminyldiphosphoundecaprenol N-acetyl-beta-D-mannosaminyltransferase